MKKFKVIVDFGTFGAIKDTHKVSAKDKHEAARIIVAQEGIGHRDILSIKEIK